MSFSVLFVHSPHLKAQDREKRSKSESPIRDRRMIREIRRDRKIAARVRDRRK